MRILIVGACILFRKVVRDTLADFPQVEFVGVADQAGAALAKIAQLRPDLVVFDDEPPELIGTRVLEELRAKGDRPASIVLCSPASGDHRGTNRPLELGALAAFPKSVSDEAATSTHYLRQRLLPVVQELMDERDEAVVVPELIGGSASDGPEPVRIVDSITCRRFMKGTLIDVVGIGVSTGGPEALAKVLPHLPADLPVSLVIVQHMPPRFTHSLATDLDKLSEITVREAEHGQSLECGCVYIAPGGRQLKIVKGIEGGFLHVNDDPPERSCRPSIDYLFRSLATVYGSHALGIVMTGMGDDGALGCQRLKRHGAQIVVQDEDSCVVYGMPRQVLAAGAADAECKLAMFPELILAACGSQELKCR